MINDKIMRDKNKIQKNKEKSIKKLEQYLQELLDSDKVEYHKKVDLLSYWIKDYTNYIKSEKQFEPLKQENYKRGNIVKVNLGFNIGSEQGGLHYAIVINNPDKSSNTLTIVPLTSAKNQYKINKSTVNLGTSIMQNIILKLKTISEELAITFEKLQLIENNVTKEKEIKKLEKKLVELNKYINEAKKIKKSDSIALVGNITTISKQRIYTPTLSNKFLKGISISNEQLDLIDKKIIELYTKNI